MAKIANTLQTYDAVGNREQLADVIYDISPMETPFLTGAGRGKVKGTFNEWQVDELAAAVDNNQHIEGDDIAAFDASAQTVRVGNYTEIARKTVIVSGTQEAVEKAGRKSDLARQIAKKGKEMKRDMEKSLLANKAAAAGAAATARTTGSLLAWVKTNVDKEATGVDPVYTTIPTDTRTDGVARALTEAMFKNVIADCWTNGGSPKIAMVGAFNKGAMSAFTGVATKTIDQSAAKPATVVGAVDIYVSDFGTLRIVPNRFQRARDLHVLDFEMVSVEYLRPFRTSPLAKTGDAEKRLLLSEFMLKVKNEKGLGLVADLTVA